MPLLCLSIFVFLLIIEPLISISLYDPSKRPIYRGCHVVSSSMMPEQDSCQFTASCRHCRKTFTSRNGLFRHLRNEKECGAKSNLKRGQELVKKHFALLFAYQKSFPADDDATAVDDIHLGTSAGRWLEQFFIRALRNGTNATNEVQFSIISRTQSSVTKLRSTDLEQDAECMACGDVLVLTIQMPVCIADDPLLLERLVTPILSPEFRFENNGIVVDLLVCKVLDDDMTLHAERSCTQYAYHYLLPIAWLPQSEQLKAWVASNNMTAPPPVDSLRRLKQHCRSAESKRVDPRAHFKDDSNSNGSRIALGRFGALGHRERRAWHNYCDLPISHNHESGWRVIDRCRIIGTPTNSHVLLEIRGDGLLKGQVRRLVGTLVATTRGWLPETTIRSTTSNDVLIAGPRAPPGRLYLAEARFHFEEMKTGEETLFESTNGGKVFSKMSTSDGMLRLQNFILADRAKAEAAELNWLHDLKCKLSPVLSRKLEDSKARDRLECRHPMMSSSSAPPTFEKVLSLLCEIVHRKAWPDTSSARSSVIADMGADKPEARGSFTVLNPMTLDLESHLLRGNQLFPDLTVAVFELEMALSVLPRTRLTLEGEDEVIERRLPSSHCAINCDAKFLPHVDSGKGAGQSLSMIVGLGDYKAGELVVEGDPFDIRYKPLEFDGWKLRHWTNTFSGQRFSLVWFTPEKV